MRSEGITVEFSHHYNANNAEEAALIADRFLTLRIQSERLLQDILEAQVQ